MLLGAGRCGCSRPKDKNGDSEGHCSGERHAHAGVDKHFLLAHATGTGREKRFYCGRRSAARRHSQDLRVLLDRVLREVDNLPEDLRTAIEKVLA